MGIEREGERESDRQTNVSERMRELTENDGG